MNVLVCTELHFTQVGDQVYCRLLTPSMFQRYREVWEEVIVLGRVQRATEPPKNVPPLNFDGVRMAGLPDYVGLLQYWRCRRKIREIADHAVASADSIVLRIPGLVSTIVWSLVCASKRPYAVEVVGDPLDAFASGAVRHLLRPIIRWTAARQMRAQCQGAYAAAYVTANRLQERYPTSREGHGVSVSDVELPSHAIAQSPRTAFTEGGLHRIVSVGTFSQMYKGQDVLLHALARLKSQGIHFEMVFVGDGKHRAEMESLATALGIHQHTKFLGELPAGDAVRSQLDRAHLFVLPSRTEGLPRALIEAMARALPSIATDVGGIPELLHPDDLVSADNPQELGERLARCLLDEKRMAEMSRRNLSTAAKYNEKLLDSRRLDFYQRVRAGTQNWLEKHRNQNFDRLDKHSRAEP